MENNSHETDPSQGRRVVRIKPDFRCQYSFPTLSLNPTLHIKQRKLGLGRLFFRAGARYVKGSELNSTSQNFASMLLYKGDHVSVTGSDKLMLID